MSTSGLRKVPEFCEACGVGMVSQRVWWATPVEEREEMKADGYRVQGIGGLCANCRSRAKNARLKAARLQDEG